MTGTLMLGIGNTLLSDEGVGVHVIEYLARHFASEEGVTYLDGGTLSFTLAEPIARHQRLIVIDAARLNTAPGTVRALIGDDIDGYLTGNRHSVHEVGLLDLLNIARLSDCYPLRRALIGIQPQGIDWGEHPTPAVAAAIPLAAQTALQLHRQWRDG